jgi:ribose 5-phosphate isomerase A
MKILSTNFYLLSSKNDIFESSILHFNYNTVIMDINDLKRQAAETAVGEIKSGMIIGLGSGSTSQFAIEAVAKKLKNQRLRDIRCVPSSVNTERVAKSLGIKLVTFEEIYGKVIVTGSDSDAEAHEALKPIDITIDGADEVDKDLNLIKGGGGAHLREKILAQASKRLFIIVDESKISETLGTKWAVPVEVIRFALKNEIDFLQSLGASVEIRKDPAGNNFVTDEKNFILDASFGKIIDVEKTASLLDRRAGIVEHGLFIGLTDTVFCARGEGTEIIRNKKR